MTERIYLIKGRISNICDFRVTHTGGKGEHLFVFAPREAADKLKAGEKYDLTFLSAEEKRTFQVPYTESRTRLTLQTRALRAAGLDVDGLKKMENRLVELEMRNLSQPDRGLQRFFIVLEQTRGVAVLNIERGGGRQGDVYELVTAKQPTIKEFVTDFNVHRGKELQNVLLGLESKRLWMNIDGKRFDFKECGMDASNLRLFVDAKLEPFKKDFRFIFDGKAITPKFGDSWRIQSLAKTENGMSMTYSMGTRTITTHSEIRYLKEDRWEMTQFLERVKILGQIREIEGNHWLEVHDSLFEYVYGRITMATVERGYLYDLERGNLGEDIGIAAFSKMGWEEVVRHPFADGGPGRESYQRGTDSLFRNKVTGELFLVEIRWWKDPIVAMEDAIKEVKQRELAEKVHEKWGEIKGAYAVSLNFDLRSATAELLVRRVW